MIKNIVLTAFVGGMFISCASTQKPITAEHIEKKGPISIEEKKGLSIYKINTDYGQIKIYLPKNPVVKHTFSGRVFAVPEGKTEEEKDKNLEQLEGLIVSLVDPNTGKETNARIGEVLKIVPENTSFYSLTIKKENKYIAKSKIFISKAPNLPKEIEIKEKTIPDFTTNSIIPFKSGLIDGDISNTLAFSDTQACIPLAEIEKLYTVASCNLMTPGLNNISFYEKGKKIYSGDINYVLCRITGQTKLILGQKTNFQFTIEGKNLKNFKVYIESEGAIKVPIKEFFISEDKIKYSKEELAGKEFEKYTFTVPVIAVKPGSFKIKCKPEKKF